MPSFDIVSNVDSHEITNAVDQASREVNNRFDFKGSNAQYELADLTLTLTAPSDFQLKQMQEILNGKLVKRELDIRSFHFQPPVTSINEARQQVEIRQGIPADLAKKIVKDIKAGKIKVQAAIQGDSIRVSGKKRDDLQAIMTQLREGNYEIPLQFENFRD